MTRTNTNKKRCQCGSYHIVKAGFTKVARKQQWRCKTCGYTTTKVLGNGIFVAKTDGTEVIARLLDECSTRTRGCDSCLAREKCSEWFACISPGDNLDNLKKQLAEIL